MSDKVSLSLKEREVVGKKVKQLRSNGLVPGVVYGAKLKSKNVVAEGVELEKVWRQAGKHQPVELAMVGGKKLAMIKSVDLDPIKHKLRHVSFHVVKQNEKVETEVAIRIENEGQTPAEKAGLVVLQALEKVEIKALPANLPEYLEVRSEGLVEPGDHASVADIKPVEGVEIENDPEQIVASVYEPAALAAKNEEAAGDAEPGDESEVESEEGSAEESESGNEQSEEGSK